MKNLRFGNEQYGTRIDGPRRKKPEKLDLTVGWKKYIDNGDENGHGAFVLYGRDFEDIARQISEMRSETVPTRTAVPGSPAHQKPYIVDGEPSE